MEMTTTKSFTDALVECLENVMKEDLVEFVNGSVEAAPSDAKLFKEQMPLRDLLTMVPEKQTGTAPTRKCLKNKHVPIAVYTTPDYRMKVYENGFALVESFKRWTVVRLSDCRGDYRYKSNVPMVEIDPANATTMVVDEAFLMEQPWTIRVTLTGEDQLERNSELRFERMIWQHPDIAEDKKYMHGGYYTFEDILLHRMELQEALMKLTDKQLDVIQRYYFAGYTQQEIAKMLGISITSVQNRLAGAVKKLRKLLTE